MAKLIGQQLPRRVKERLRRLVRLPVHRELNQERRFDLIEKASKAGLASVQPVAHLTSDGRKPVWVGVRVECDPVGFDPLLEPVKIRLDKVSVLAEAVKFAVDFETTPR
jgi:hypothetical protein